VISWSFTLLFISSYQRSGFAGYLSVFFLSEMVAKFQAYIAIPRVTGMSNLTARVGAFCEVGHYLAFDHFATQSTQKDELKYEIFLSPGQRAGL